jgi:predicted ester cyclase
MQPKDVVDRFFTEVWNGRRLEVADEIIAAECVTHQLRSADGPQPSAPRGPAALKEHIASWLAAIPDIVASVEASVAEGDRVVSWVAMRGTQTGSWMSVPPTDRAVVIRSVVMHRIADDRIVEDWVIAESMGFFQQLGVIAPTGQLLAQAPVPAATAADDLRALDE